MKGEKRKKLKLSHKSFSFPPLQELIYQPFVFVEQASQDTRSGLGFSRDQIWVRERFKNAETTGKGPAMESHIQHLLLGSWASQTDLQETKETQILK